MRQICFQIRNYKKISTFVLILIVSSVILGSTGAYAETSKIKSFGKYNIGYERGLGEFDNGTVDYVERIFFFENQKHAIHHNFDESPSYTELSVGSIEGVDLGMYVVFDPDKIPKSDWWTDVTINSVELKALVEEVPDRTSYKTFVTVSSCNANSWYYDAEKDFHKSIQYHEQFVQELEKITSEIDGLFTGDGEFIDENASNEYSKLLIEQRNMESKFEKLENELFGWKKEYCAFTHKPLDSVIIGRQDLPNVYVWDVTSGVIDAMSAGHVPQIFEVTATQFPEETDQIDVKDFSGLIDFSSAVEADDPSSGIGANAEPLFIVTYTIEPTAFKESLDFTLIVLIPASSIIVPAIIWFYKKAKRSKN